MATNAENPEVGPECRTKEWVDKTVCEVFDELFEEISARTVHPSETFNEHFLKNNFFDLKIYHIINAYHAFCRLCEQHFYRTSMVDDINSFFQKHLNTSYHRQNKPFSLPADDVQMFTWEEKFYSGRCNVCDMSGLNSYVLHTTSPVTRLLEEHVCVWERQQRESNENLLSKLNLLKKYCRLKIFQEKFLKTVQGREVCLLCRISFPPSKKKTVWHLSSEMHYRNFCVLLQKVFNFEPKDVLNGFNLEMITRWIITTNPPPIVEFAGYIEHDERELCLENSNSNDNPYFLDVKSLSFSPTLWRGFLQDPDIDFIHNWQCLLCNREFTGEHAKTEMHKTKVANLDKNVFGTPKNYAIYQKNREKRLYITETIERLDRGVLELDLLDISLPKPSIILFKTLLEKKLQLVNEVFTMRSGQFFCQVCDERVLLSNELAHLNSSSHKCHAMDWGYWVANLSNSKLMEPFVLIRRQFACLLCGTVFLPHEFCSHLKLKRHFQKFGRYCSLDSRVSISSAFAFREDLSCFCTLCKEPLNKRNNFSLLKRTLLNIRLHWPCPKSNKRETETVHKVNGVSTQNAKTEQNNETSNKDAFVLCSIKEHGSCAKDTVDFKKVEETMKSIVGVFENKIIETVLNKSQIMFNNSGNSKNATFKEYIKKILEVDGQPAVQKESSSPDSSNGTPSPTVSEKEEVKRNQETSETNETTQGKISDAEKEKMKPVEKEENFKKDHEILVIQGLPNKGTVLLKEELYSKFSEFGNILYIDFKRLQGKKMAILAFDKPGVAKALAKSLEMYVNDNKLYLVATTTESREGTGSLPFLMNDNLVHLLGEPNQLMDLMQNLMVQAVRASKSPVEIEREKLVCSFIISAVVGHFPQARCYPFGSRLSGLILGNSDLDVFLDCGGMYGGFENTSRNAEIKLLNLVEKLLRVKRIEITDLVPVKRARVPIISFLHKSTLMHCDLSFKNGLSVQNTLITKFMISLDWRVTPLILFLKYFLKLNKLQGPPFFSSYVIVLLVFFYLAQLEKPVLPTIESLQNSYVGPRRTIAGWDCSINMVKTWKSKNLDSLPHLLLGLFEFYEQFNYDEYMVSPLTGKPLPKKAFSNSGFKNLPLSYKRHILNLPVPINSNMNTKSDICVVDPFELSAILTKSFTKDGLRMFVRFCREGAECLKKGITACQT